MGCAASVSTAPVASKLASRRQHCFHDLQVVPAAPAPAWEEDGHTVKQQESVAKDTAPISGSQGICASTDGGNGKKDNDAADAGLSSRPMLSSWDSCAWQNDAPANVPLPPDRRMHDMHVKRVGKFLREVQKSPRVLVRTVRARRGRSRGALVALQGRPGPA
mmetsp:Transcript_33277/g.76787  ORF Transcript_33277/g.76787 Transcript_33277/m.76787 type:complete len:162 (+) Transcript_33277:30-515(+)